MENTFFLPVGRQLLVETADNGTYKGELLGIINLAGIPAIWLRDKRASTTFEYILPLIQIHAVRIEKEPEKLLLSGNTREIKLEPNDEHNG
jgi:hypothetical protein